MKVGTDGVLLGAWVNVSENYRILDVGTGTGLIALMVAQQNSDASIVAIDIDENAVAQAKHNFSSSDWTERLFVKHQTLQLFSKENTNRFDHVVCNPPFFNESLKSDNHSRNLARHTDSLSYLELIKNSHRVTSEDGKLSVILPAEAENKFIELACNEFFYPVRITRIKPTPQKSYVRSLVELSKRRENDIISDEMIIEDKGRHGYSDDYIALTRSFYLKM